jgi:hypothetical protein
MSGEGAVVVLTGSDFARHGLDPARDRPLTAVTVEELRIACGRWAGVRPQGVVAFPFASLAPIPLPVRARPGGAGRLPATVTTAGARHPVWWLDPAVSARDPGEAPLAYGVRLALEVGRRGLSGPDGTPLDALALLGWAPGDPEIDGRLRRYARGGWDPDLARFTLPPPAGGQRRRAQLRAEAASYLAPRLALLAELEERLATSGGGALAPHGSARGRSAVEGGRWEPRAVDLDGLVLPPPPP